MKDNTFNKLILFLQNLEQQHISYTLAHYRDEAIMIIVTLPGERWEIEFLNDGSVEVEKFISDGNIAGEEALDELFIKYSAKENSSQKSQQNTDIASF